MENWSTGNNCMEVRKELLKNEPPGCRVGRRDWLWFIVNETKIIPFQLTQLPRSVCQELLPRKRKKQTISPRKKSFKNNIFQRKSNVLKF